MRTLLLNIFNGRVVSPWWILLIDMGITVNSFAIAFVLRLNVDLSYYSVTDLVLAGAWVQAVYLVSFMLFGSYRGVIRHSSYNELKQLIKACFVAFFVLLISHSLIEFMGYGWFNTPRLVLVFHFLLSAMLCFLFRMLVKEMYSSLTKKRTSTNVFIYGEGEMGHITLY